MKTEREMFEAYFKTVWKGIDLIQTVGEDFAFKLLDGKYVEDIVEEHWRTWEASAQRQGCKLVPVETLEECLSWACCASSESWTDDQRDEIDKHYKVIEKAMIGVSE